MNLDTSDNISEQHLMVANEEKVAIRVAEAKVSKGFIGDKRFEEGGRMVEGVEGWSREWKEKSTIAMGGESWKRWL